MATPVNPTNTPATVQPGASKSNLASLSPEQASRIQSKRDANYGVSTSSPQLLSNPRTQVTATGTQQISTPTAGGVQQKEATPTMVDNPRITTSPEGVELKTPGEAYKAAEAATPQVPQAPQTPAPTTATVPPARTGDVAMTAGGQMNEGADGKGTERTTPGIGFDAATGLEGTPPPAPAQSAADVAAEVDTFTGTIKEQANAKSTWDRAGQLGNIAPLSTTEMSSGQKEVDKILKDPLKATNVPEGTDPYTANVNQLIAAMEAGQIQSDAATDKIIDIMQKRKSNMELGAMEAEDRSIRDAANLMERIKHEREQAAQQIQYELGRGTQDREKNIDQMEEDNSRLWGFMQRRLAKMGATNSSYAVAQLQKYTSLATSQLSDARVELSDYRAMMVGKEQDLAYKYGNQLMDIQNNLEDTLQQNRRQMYDQMLDIDQNILQSEVEKTKARQGLMIQMTQMKNEAQAQADSHALQVKNQALSEAQFAFTKLQTNKDNEYRAMSFTEQVRQFNKGFTMEEDMFRTQETGYLHFGGSIAMDPETGKPIRTMSGKSYDQQIDSWLTDMTGNLHRNGMDTGEATWARDSFMLNYNRAVKESDRAYGFDVAGARTNATGDFYDPVTGEKMGRSMTGMDFDLKHESNKIDMAIKKINAGISDPSTLNEFKTAYDVMGQGVYVELPGGKTTWAGDLLTKGMETVSKFIGNSNFQCVQAVRALKLPGFPQSGLTTIADKLKNLVDTSAGFKPGEMMPQVLDTIVLDYGVIDPTTGQNYGHVATVLGTNPETGEVTFQNHNIPKNKGSISTMSMKNAKIKGYWRSPAVKVQQSSPQQDQINRVTAGMTAEKQKSYQSIMENQLKSGDLTGFASTVQQAAYETMTATSKNIYDNAGVNAQRYADAKNTIEGFKGSIKESNPGIYNAMFESGKTLAQLETDPEYQSVRQSVMMPSLQLASELFGAAQSVPEMKRAMTAIPNSESMTFKDMQNLSAGLEDYYRRTQGIMINNVSKVRPPINSRGLIETPFGEITPDEYDNMMALSS